jgi:hypothetical protein
MSRGRFWLWLAWLTFVLALSLVSPIQRLLAHVAA